MNKLEQQLTKRRWRHLDLERLATGALLEIGPFVNPVLANGELDNVSVLDIKDTETLRSEAAALGMDPNRIPHVQLVSDVSSLGSAVGDAKYDLILACQVLEHAPCPISFLQDAMSCLTPNGRLAISIPDMRSSFDREREATALSGVLDAYAQKREGVTVGQVVDHMYHAVHIGKQNNLSGPRWRRSRKVHGLGEVREAWQLRQATPTDLVEPIVHAWTFTPKSFRNILQALIDLDLLPANIEKFSSRQPEIYVVLSPRTGNAKDTTRHS